MLSSCDLVALIATADSERSLAFYADILGLALIADEPYALVFDANGTMLRVQKVDDVAPVSYTRLGWSTRDVVAEMAALTARGVTFERYDSLEQDALGVWRSPSGAKVAWFKDPDGNLLSLTEF